MIKFEWEKERSLSKGSLEFGSVMIERASPLFVCYISLLYHSGILNGWNQSSSTSLLPVLVGFNLGVEIQNWSSTRSFLFNTKPKFNIKVERNCDVLTRVRMYKNIIYSLDYFLSYVPVWSVQLICNRNEKYFNKHKRHACLDSVVEYIVI